MVVMTTRGRAVVLVVALALAASLLTLAVVLAKPAQAQAQIFIDKDQSRFSQFVIGCTEEVFVEGTLNTLTHTTTDANGGSHTKLHLNLQGQGEGVSSGDNYVFHSEFNANENFTDALNTTFTQTFQIKRQGSATPTDDQEFRVLFHVTVNAQGEVTAEVVNVEEVCR
jgi:hypothetical protein